MRGAVVVVCVVGAVFAAGWLCRPGAAVVRKGCYVGEKVIKTDAEWRQVLTDEQYRVTRRKGTERAFTGEYADCHEDGVYTCVCCGQPLFDSSTKYDSGTGWPSFWEPIAPDRVDTEEDRGWLGTRTEVLCSRCDAHLGHVFEDGPAPTGLRFCMNSAALRLVRRGAEAGEEK